MEKEINAFDIWDDPEHAKKIISKLNSLKNVTNNIIDVKNSILNDIDIRKFGSQGQQRTAALSLKLAEIRLIKEITGEDAVLLLDDVLSELDKIRQSYLVNCLNTVQIFITTTEISEEVADSFPDGITYRIKNGTIEK